jgi:hypothetical protein
MWSRHCGETIPTLTYTQVTAFARVPVPCVLAVPGDRLRHHSEGQQSQHGILGHAAKVEARAEPNESHARRPVAPVGAGSVFR